jgi:hypothetical protein
MHIVRTGELAHIKFPAEQAALFPYAWTREKGRCFAAVPVPVYVKTAHSRHTAIRFVYA